MAGVTVATVSTSTGDWCFAIAARDDGFCNEVDSARSFVTGGGS